MVTHSYDKQVFFIPTPELPTRADMLNTLLERCFVDM